MRFFYFKKRFAPKNKPSLYMLDIRSCNPSHHSNLDGNTSRLFGLLYSSLFPTLKMWNNIEDYMNIQYINT